MDDLLRKTDPPVRRRPVRCNRSPHADPSAGMAKGAVRVTICAAGRSPTGTWGPNPGSGWEVGVHDLRLPWVARPCRAKN